ncbi:MAG: hypothetical protein KAH33_00570 [Candidatus Delongbacteria bacterium]|nr:hypothetical protein [Candidatus Delongbacteria bacterium]
MKIILITLLLGITYLFSVEFDVISFKKNSIDLAGRRNVVNDDEGNPCALIRVNSDLDQIKFEGSGIVKKGMESSGKYYIYIKQMSNSITLIGKDINSMEFEFPIPLESTIVYNLDLSQRDGLTNLEAIENLISSEDSEIKGTINNLQSAPFNENIISFEVKFASDMGFEDDKTVKLFLYNVSTKKLLRIESSKIGSDTSEENKFYTKDRSLSWHPTKNWFVFNGNGFKKRENLYICEIKDTEFNDQGSVKGYMISLYNQRNERSYCMYPSFNSSGKDLYFSRQLKKKNKKAKYNKSYSLAMISDVFENKSENFKKINFRILSEEKFDQFRITCSPNDPNLVAYISYKHKIRDLDNSYVKYQLNIYDKRSKTFITINDLDGFKDYSFQWSNNGEYIFYNKAVSLDQTDKSFIKDKINKINLYYSKILNENGKLSFEVQNNDSTSILLEDVPDKNFAIAFLNDTQILVSKYAPYNSLCIVDLQKWKNGVEPYYEKLDFLNDTDSPALARDKMFYIEYEYPEEKTIVSVKSVELTK